MSKPTVGVLYAPGTNSHAETMWAFERVGATPELLFLGEILSGAARLDGADLLCIPGGFAYGDHTGAGNVAGQLLKHRLGNQLRKVAEKPLIAICNGFQVAVRAGLFGDGVALALNDAGTFRNIVDQRHIVLDADNVWTRGLTGATVQFPCAHGEGRFVYDQDEAWNAALRYPAGENPDGSMDDIAGIVSANGLVFGLMDHPERAQDNPGTLDIFAGGVSAAG